MHNPKKKKKHSGSFSSTISFIRSFLARTSVFVQIKTETANSLWVGKEKVDAEEPSDSFFFVNVFLLSWQCNQIITWLRSNYQKPLCMRE